MTTEPREHELWRTRIERALLDLRRDTFRHLLFVVEGSNHRPQMPEPRIALGIADC